MTISTKGRYALRALGRLATFEQHDPVPLQQIAAHEEISLLYLEQLFFRLRKAGLISSTKGARGGFLLSRRPDEITLTEIFEAVGESVEDGTPAAAGAGSRAGSRRSTETMWTQVERQVQTYFSSLTLQDLLDRQKDGNGDLL